MTGPAAARELAARIPILADSLHGRAQRFWTLAHTKARWAGWAQPPRSTTRAARRDSSRLHERTRTAPGVLPCSKVGRGGQAAARRRSSSSATGANRLHSNGNITRTLWTFWR